MAWCRRHPEGLVLHLHAREVNLLRFLGRELRRLLENADMSRGEMTGFSPARQRAQDPQAAWTELDESMDAELMQYRLERLETVQRELLGDAPVDEAEGLTLTLTPERTDTWLAWITDLRLLLAVVLNLTPENPDRLDRLPPEEWLLEHRMYFFLSELQELMIAKIMD